MDSEIVQVSTIEEITRAEIDIQIATAKKFPRDIRQSVDRATKLATLDQNIAEECNFSLPRGGKNIEGPSVRLAEIIGPNWGNLRVQSRVVGVDETCVICQGVCLDLETNYAVSSDVRRKIVDSKGRRYNEDMITLTANAGCSIARRDAIFHCIPKPIWWPVYQAALRVASNGATEVNIVQRRARALEWFGNRGIDAGKVLAKLGVQKIPDISPEHLQTLSGWKNSVNESHTTIEDLFGLGDAWEGESTTPAAVEVKKPAAQAQAPAQAVQPAPAAPATETPTDNRERAELWTAWSALRTKLSAAQLKSVKESAKVEWINAEITLDQLRAVVLASKEITEAA